MPKLLLVPGVGSLVAACVLMGAASSAVWTFGRDLLVSAGGLGEEISTIAWIVLGVFGMLGAAAGDLANRIGLRRSWLLMMFVVGATTAVLASAPGSILIAFVALSAFSASYQTLTGLLLVWGTEMYPQFPTAGVGLAFFIGALGQAAGALLIGAAAELWGLPSAFLFAAALAIVGGFVRPAK